MHRITVLLFAAALLAVLPFPAQGIDFSEGFFYEWDGSYTGCLKCKLKDWSATKVNYRCYQVGDGDSGSGTFCTNYSFGQGRSCDISGGYCTYVVVPGDFPHLETDQCRVEAQDACPASCDGCQILYE